MERKEITIKPVVKPKFSGISSYSKSHCMIEGAQLSKNGYKTGLTREEQEYYENLLQKPKGFLSTDNAAFWSTILNLNLPNDKPYTFVVNSPMDELKLKVIMERNDIANNELELAKMPYALFYIEDKEAKAKVEEVSINFQMEAHEKFSELTIAEKKGYLKLYGKRGVDTLSDTIVKTELFKEVNKDPKKFLDMTKNPDIELRIEIENMLETGTLVKSGSYYSFNEEVIGNTIDSVIAYFKDYKNQSIKIAAIQTAKNKKKGA